MIEKLAVPNTPKYRSCGYMGGPNDVASTASNSQQ
jgi:hypothetical protein